jgi:aspartyl-tRNA(Asn)/glutamyl-tRNA(Gln) amidotransferase subunit A
VAEALAGRSLTEIAAAIAAKQVSALEVTRACLARIEAWQPRINAFITLEAEPALEAAARADAALARGTLLGPLHGVPLAHKDMFARAGTAASGGSRILGELVAGDTATVLERLASAGAISLGRLNMSEFAAGPTGHNAHWGDCRNPWNTAHIAGGSSSGSGAAVAARLVYGALGSDTGGSVRLPAGFCGVVGLKPTYGRVSRHGAMPRAWSLDAVGPLARTARDCALLTGIVAGYDPRDATSSRDPVPDYVAALADGASGLRLGAPPEAVTSGWSPAIVGALDTALAVFRDVGAPSRVVDLPDFTGLYALADAVSKSEAAAMHGRWLRERPQDYSVHVRSRTEAGLHIPAARYLEALAIRGKVAAGFVGTVFAEIDVLVLPVLAVPVPTIAETDVEASAEIPGVVAGITQLTRPFNYLGLPALALPVGFDPNGVPISLQLVARPFNEALLFRLAHAYQAATDWHRRLPTLT